MPNFSLPNLRIPRSPRSFIAIALIAFSLIAALAIASEAGGTTEVWSTSRELSVGHQITNADLVKTKVLIPKGSELYMAASKNLVGLVVARSIGASELIAQSAISKVASKSALASLPVRVARGDMPGDLTVGQKVDIYSIPTLNSLHPFDPILTATKIAVESIDQKSKDLGGEIGIVLSVPTNEVLPIINDIENNRVLVVRNAI